MKFIKRRLSLTMIDGTREILYVPRSPKQPEPGTDMEDDWYQLVIVPAAERVGIDHLEIAGWS